VVSSTPLTTSSLVETSHCTRRMGDLLGSGSVWRLYTFEKHVTSAAIVTHDWGLNVGGSWNVGVGRGSGVALRQHG